MESSLIYTANPTIDRICLKSSLIYTAKSKLLVESDYKSSLICTAIQQSPNIGP